ncbi:MAG: hypothetical protein K1X40_11865, partial [Chitinophagales bacterium]|nr:hypothetical protein [Chitinophagales bacterium]
MADQQIDMSLSGSSSANFNGLQKTGIAITSIGILFFFIAWFGVGNQQPLICLLITLAGFIIGGITYSFGTYG